MSEVIDKLSMKQEFPRSSKYDIRWALKNQMGLNALWLTEYLCQGIKFNAKDRVLDLGCGKALSSIFLKKEYKTNVIAADLWIDQTDNYKRIQEMAEEKNIFPVYANAKELPFAHNYFDAILCVDSYIYFGTDDLYLNYLLKFIKPGGVLAIIVPAWMQEVHNKVPKHFEPFWAQDCWTWHTKEWWKGLWERTGLVDIEVVDEIPNGCQLYVEWKKARLEMLLEEKEENFDDASVVERRTSLESDIQCLEKDAGNYFGFVRMIARKKD